MADIYLFWWRSNLCTLPPLRTFDVPWPFELLHATISHQLICFAHWWRKKIFAENKFFLFFFFSFLLSDSCEGWNGDSWLFCLNESQPRSGLMCRFGINEMALWELIPFRSIAVTCANTETMCPFFLSCVPLNIVRAARARGRFNTFFQ